MNTILQDIIEHHIWANDTLLAFCEKLTPDQLALTVPGTFGTVEETLVHVAANEEAYLHGLAELGVGDEMRATIFDGDVPRELAVVRPVLVKTADAWRRIVTEWPQNDVKEFPGEGKVERLPISVVVTQVIDHGTEHRTHIRTILATHGVARPVDEGTTEPNIDGWAWNDARATAS